MANILAYSFGEEGIDRHLVIFKKEHAPTEEQLNALRNGEEWDEDFARNSREKSEKNINTSKEKNIDFVPNSNYQDKYEHLIGKTSALEAARKTVANSNYGCGKIT